MIDIFYVHLEFKAKSGDWSINLPFLCTKCGVCCTLDDFLTAGEVRINPLENPRLHAKLNAIYNELGRRWEAGEVKYDQYITHTPCPFLKNKRCSIYEVRPEGCRQYPNTCFGMQTQDCMALNRLKRQCAILTRGRAAKRTCHFTTKPLIEVKFTNRQYQTCIAKLLQIGISRSELSLLNTLNGQEDSTL